MSMHSSEPSMRQKIFSMDLDVETVSVYLLCCAVIDGGATITPDALMDKWNGGRASLDRALEQLEKRNIIGRTEGEGERPSRYRMVDERHWC